MVRGPGSAPRGVVTFAWVLVGQVVSQFGSHLTSFVLGVWIYERTGSATQFALVAFFITVPQMLALPFAGALVDRWDRRWALILSDSGAGLSTLILLALVWTERLEVWCVYAVVASSSTFSALQGPAFSASTPLLVAKKHLVRANGLVELGMALALMAAPGTAGFLLGKIGLVGVIWVDVLTFSFALLTLLTVRIPRPAPAAPAGRRSLLREAAFGWLYIRQRRGLLALLALFATANFIFGTVQVSLTPLVLSFASASQLGMVLSIAVGGMVAGSSAVVVWGGPRRQVPVILTLLGLQGVILFLGGARPSVPLIAAAAFTYMLFQPAILACSQTIWQTKVNVDVQGRVFAIRRLVANSAVPLAFLLAGPLADYVFEPLLAAEGALAGTVGRWIGTGSGRGVGLLFICLGGLTLAALVAGACYRPLRDLEDDLPDAIGEPDAARPLSS